MFFYTRGMLFCTFIFLELFKIIKKWELKGEAVVLNFIYLKT